MRYEPEFEADKSDTAPATEGPFRLERGDWGTRVVNDQGTIIIAAARDMTPVRDAANAAANRWATKYKQERDEAIAEVERLKMELARCQESMSTADRGRERGGEGEYVVLAYRRDHDGTHRWHRISDDQGKNNGTKSWALKLGRSCIEYVEWKEVRIARITHIVRPGPATVEEV